MYRPLIDHMPECASGGLYFPWGVLPVGCMLPGGVYASRGVCLLPGGGGVLPWGGGCASLGRGVCFPGGVCASRGVCFPGEGGVLPWGGGCASRGVCVLPGGVCFPGEGGVLPGGYPSIH